MKLNKHYLDLKDSYLFSTIAQKAAAHVAAHPDAQVLRLGIGDVTRPLPPVVVDAMTAAVADMGAAATFKGYGPEQGYPFLRESIQSYYASKGVSLAADEIFVGDGAKSDIGNILDLFDKDNNIIIPDPVYPAYVDANVMDGRKIYYIDGHEENGFLPMPDALAGQDVKPDIIYMCSPNNPTGAVYTHAQLKVWVDYALEHGAIILFDGAYECFIGDKSLPSSIFEIEGARKCAIEICSLSKMAGFTGVRCGFTTVPHDLQFDGQNLNKMWSRRQATKFNGVSYIVQRGAAAAFSPEGLAQCHENISAYMANAEIIAKTMKELNIWHVGGDNAPYVWLKCPSGLGSWEFFDKLLKEAHIVGTPGAGFGTKGEGYFRLSAFNSKENVIEAMNRLKKIL
ncbi:MAG: LL-diaminopimelate aminotransferase [Defluviitaleaceae bacterium]|nr:LL-diaminopimelate aminotransferase [Defluviitaleaceae bacterium]